MSDCCDVCDALLRGVTSAASLRSLPSRDFFRTEKSLGPKSRAQAITHHRDVPDAPRKAYGDSRTGHQSPTPRTYITILIAS